MGTAVNGEGGGVLLLAVAVDFLELVLLRLLPPVERLRCDIGVG